MKTLQGTITICKMSGSSEDIRIEVTDENSHVRVLTLTMTPEDFANALFSHIKPCIFEIAPDNNVWGLLREHKKEQIAKPTSMIFDKRELIDWIQGFSEPFEVDGWEAQVEASLRIQQSNPKCYNIAFVRYVDQPKKN